MHDNLHMVKLGEICRIIGGGTPSKKNEEYYKGDIPWASVRDMNCQYLKNTEFKITRQAVNESATNIIPCGEIVIATHVGLGKVCVLCQDTAINQDLKAIIPLGELHRKYLYFWFVSKAKVFIANGKGATVKGVTVDFVKDLQIPLPPLAEQNRIAEELDNICAAKKDAEAIVEKLKLLAKSLFVEMFGEQESAKYPLLEIGSLFKVGGPKRIHQREWTEEGVPFLRVSDVVSKIKGDISLPAMYISNDRYAELKEAGAVPSAGDILVTARGTLGECYIVKADDAFYFQDGMITWLSVMDGRLDVTYIVNAMRQDGFRRQFLGKEVGSTVAYLSISQLAKLKVIVPPLPLQRQYAAFIEQLDKSLFEAQALIGKLDLLYRAKLQEYFG